MFGFGNCSHTDFVISSAAYSESTLTLSEEERNTKWKLARQLVERDDLNLWFKHQIDDINKLLDPYARSSH